MRLGECRNEKDLLAALESARKTRLERRRGFEAVWWDNIALVVGDHYSRWNVTLSRFEDRDTTFDEELETRKPKLVINHALTVARTELSKLTKAHPIMEVIANTNEEADIAATKVAKSGLDYAEWKFKLMKLRKDALWWGIQTGLGAIYVGWDHLNTDSGAFDFVIDPATGEPTFNPVRVRELEQQVTDGLLDGLDRESMPMGELEYKVYSPFQLFPDETALDFDSINDLITTEIVDVDVLRGVYGKAADKVQPEQVQLGTMEQRTLMRMGGLVGEINRNAQSSPESACYLHTWWLLPGVYRNNPFLSDGKLVRWVTNATLDMSRGFPYQDGRMPFCFFQHIPTSTSIWPDCVINHIRGPNLEIDKAVSQLIENKDYMSNPMWRVATQHRIKGKPRNVAGGIIRYVHSPNVPPPEPVPGLEMPKQVEDLISSLQEQILEISGQSEVARGRVPTGVRSGVAVAYLQEEDDTKIAPTVENMEQAIARMGSLTLERFSQFYTVERIIRFYRRDGSFDSMKFKGADLKNNTDVICQAGSAMPKSKAARQQYTLELVSLGILQDPVKIFEMLELGQGEPTNQEKSRAQADRENNIMRFGMPRIAFHPYGDTGNLDWLKRPPGTQEDEQKYLATAVPVRDWHDHNVHLERHYAVMMEAEFETLQITHPWVVRLFDEHVAMHQQAIAAQQQQQMQMLMAAKGAPGGAPAGDQAQPGGMMNNGAAGLPNTGSPNSDIFKTMADVPDFIGGGVLRSRAQRTTPQPGG